MVFSKVRISRLFQGLGFVGFFKGLDLMVLLKDWFSQVFSIVSDWLVSWIGSFSWLAKQTG